MLLEDRLLTGWRALLALAVLAGVTAMLGVVSMPVLDRDEARFAQATAQMLETGDWVQIHFLDEPRHKKPIGIYWMQAISAGLFNAEDSRAIWAFRLPSVLGAMLAVLTAFWAGRRLYGASTGFAGASLLAVSILLASEGGIAKTDAMLTAATGASFAALIGVYLAPDDRARRWWAVGVWAAVALGALIKGPITPMIVGLAVLALCAWDRRVTWLKVFFFWPGPVIAAVIILPWLVGVQLATDGAFLRDAIGGDLAPKMTSGHEGHGAPPGSYLVLLSVLFLPAILTLPAGVSALVQDWRDSQAAPAAVKLLTAFIVPGWLVFELAPTKLPHYILPLLPALAVVSGVGLVRWRTTPRVWRGVGLALFALGVLVAGGLLIGLVWGFEATALSTYLGVGVMGACAGLTGVLMARNALTAGLIAAVLTALSWHVTGRAITAPSASLLFPSEAVAALVSEVRAQVPDGTLISTYTEPSLVFRTHGDITLSASEDLAASLRAGRLDFSAPRLYVFDLSRWTDEDAAALETLVRAACTVRLVDGFNYSRGDQTVLLIAATGCVPDTGPDPRSLP